MSNLKDKSIKPRILVVDDTFETRFYIKSILENYEIIEAVNGVEAWQIITNQNIDVLITDYLMPIMDGYELIQKIKKENFTFPIIVITGLDSDIDKLNMLRLGIDNYIRKPFFKEELNAIIERAIVYHKTILVHKKASDKQDEPLEVQKFKEQLELILFNNTENNLFGVEDIAEAFNFSSKTLARKTKAIYGQTPNQLILEFRLQKAKDLLNQYPNISLNQLTKMVGLKNSSYLKKRMDLRFDS